MGSLLSTAIDMAQQQYAVFPLIPNGKTPLLSENWREISSADPEFVASAWDADSDANVGIDTGKSGVIIVDVDVKTGNGIKVWDMLKRKYAVHRGDEHLETWTVRTASGGLHVYFEAGDIAMRNSASMIGSWIDIRAQGGYVVGWGSTVNDREYTVILEAPPMPIPNWLVEVEQRARHRREAADVATRQEGLMSIKMLSNAGLRVKLDGLQRKLAEKPEPGRNDLLNRTAFQLGMVAAAGRITEDDAWEICVYATEANGLMADGEYGVRATFASGFKAGLEGRR